MFYLEKENIAKQNTSNDILEELINEENENKINKKVKNFKINSNKKTIAKIAAGFIIMTGVTSSLTISLTEAMKPINVVKKEMILDAGLYEYKTIKEVEGTMTLEELKQYIEEHELPSNEIEKVIRKYIEKQNPSEVDESMNKIDEANPGILNLNKQKVNHK